MTTNTTHITKQITLCNGHAWLDIVDDYIIIQMDMFPVTTILSQLAPMLVRLNRGTHDPTRNSYGISTDICNALTHCGYISKSGIMTLNIGFAQLISPRDSDVYEEIYLGTISNSNIPIHHLAYIEITIDTCTYSIAIEHSIRTKSRAIQLFIESDYARLKHLLWMRYLPRTINNTTLL